MEAYENRRPNWFESASLHYEVDFQVSLFHFRVPRVVLFWGSGVTFLVAEKHAFWSRVFRNSRRLFSFWLASQPKGRKRERIRMQKARKGYQKCKRRKQKEEEKELIEEQKQEEEEQAAVA